MNARTLVNVAYAALAENQDADGLERLDAILEEANRKVDAERRRLGIAAPAEPIPLTPEEAIRARFERMKRSVPDQSKALASMMGRYGGTPGNSPRRPEGAPA